MLNMTDRLCADIPDGIKGHPVIDQVHDPGGTSGNEDQDQNLTEIAPHTGKVHLSGTDDLVDRVSKQNRNIQLEQYRCRSQQDAQDQEKTISSDKAKYFF